MGITCLVPGRLCISHGGPGSHFADCGAVLQPHCSGKRGSCQDLQLVMLSCCTRARARPKFLAVQLSPVPVMVVQTRSGTSTTSNICAELNGLLNSLAWVLHGAASAQASLAGHACGLASWQAGKHQFGAVRQFGNAPAHAKQRFWRLCVVRARPSGAFDGRWPG